MLFNYCILFSFLAIHHSYSCSHKRTKRVINGVPVDGRETGYNAVRYFGALAKLHGNPWSDEPYVTLPKDRTRLKYIEGMIKCGGSLLTPNIFQTACHCLSSWDKGSSGAFRSPIIDHQWENMLVVYVGVNDEWEAQGRPTMLDAAPLRSNKFIVHQKCARFRAGMELNVHDFGLIRLKRNWLSSETLTKTVKGIDFAPIYKERHLSQAYMSAMERQLVCLHLGFGVYNAEDPRWPSEVLRHGWGVILGRTECYKTIAFGVPIENLTTHGTWICSNPFPLHNQFLGKGDSGSPISCDNTYVAIASSTLESTFRVILGITGNTIVSEYLSVLSPIHFATRENAFEYRTDLENYVANYERSNPPQLPELFSTGIPISGEEFLLIILLVLSYLQ